MNAGPLHHVLSARNEKAPRQRACNTDSANVSPSLYRECKRDLNGIKWYLSKSIRIGNGARFVEKIVCSYVLKCERDESAPGYDPRVLGRISALVAAESTSDGSLTISLRAVDGVAGFSLKPATLALTIWRVDLNVIRISLMNPKTSTVAYFQGAEPALELARELGLEPIFLKENC